MWSIVVTSGAESGSCLASAANGVSTRVGVVSASAGSYSVGFFTSSDWSATSLPYAFCWSATFSGPGGSFVETVVSSCTSTT